MRRRRWPSEESPPVSTISAVERQTESPKVFCPVPGNAPRWYRATMLAVSRSCRGQPKGGARFESSGRKSCDALSRLLTRPTSCKSAAISRMARSRGFAPAAFRWPPARHRAEAPACDTCMECLKSGSSNEAQSFKRSSRRTRFLSVSASSARQDCQSESFPAVFFMVELRFCSLRSSWIRFASVRAHSVSGKTLACVSHDHRTSRSWTSPSRSCDVLEIVAPRGMLERQEVFHDVAKALDADAQPVKSRLEKVAQCLAMRR